MLLSIASTSDVQQIDSVQLILTNLDAENAKPARPRLIFQAPTPVGFVSIWQTLLPDVVTFDIRVDTAMDGAEIERQRVVRKKGCRFRHTLFAVDSAAVFEFVCEQVSSSVGGGLA